MIRKLITTTRDHWRCWLTELALTYLEVSLHQQRVDLRHDCAATDELRKMEKS